MSEGFLRSCVQDALSKGLLKSAIIFGQELIAQPNCSADDRILHAKCYFQNGEFRRCLAYLEQSQFLTASSIRSMFEEIHRVDNQAAPSPSVKIGINALLLAAQCLFSTDQLEDCLTLLEPFVIAEDDEHSSIEIISQNCRRCLSSPHEEINPLSGIYCLIGRCYDFMDNRPRSLRALICSIRIDPACVEAADMLITNGLLNSDEKHRLWNSLQFNETRQHLISIYGSLFGIDLNQTQHSDAKSVAACVRHAESLMDNFQRPDEAYRIIRQAYSMDPFDHRCLLVYVSNLMELGLKTELFYLGHELTSTLPKSALSWFTVGCYYAACKKNELALNYLQKCIRIDKRFSKAYLLLGSVLSIQEESEQAISAFRTASRLMPGDHRPLILLAKELVRTNYESLALHFLESALQLSLKDPVILNELGIVYMKLNRLEDAVRSLHLAASYVIKAKQESSEIFSNYASVLRKFGRYAEALMWYELSLSDNPGDCHTLASIAFTFHLMRRFEDAITGYHKALAVNPTSTFCAEMLTRAMEDITIYKVAAPEELI